MLRIMAMLPSGQMRRARDIVLLIPVWLYTVLSTERKCDPMPRPQGIDFDKQYWQGRFNFGDFARVNCGALMFRL